MVQIAMQESVMDRTVSVLVYLTSRDNSVTPVYRDTGTSLVRRGVAPVTVTLLDLLEWNVTR